MLVLSRKAGEALVIGDNIEIVITEVSGDKVRVGITAPGDTVILRKELCQTMESNRKAVAEVKDDTLRMLAARLGN